MNTGKLITAVAIMLAVITVECNGQPPVPGRLKDGPRPGDPERQPLQQVATFTGLAGQWVSNDDFVYDGFYLQTSSGKTLVKFPPHMGTQITKAVKTGNTVSVSGVEEINPEGVKEIHMVSMTANGQKLQNTAPADTAPIAAQETIINGSGRITAVQKGREGEVNGYVIDDKTVLRVPPHVSLQLATLVIPGANVSFTGMQKTATNGEVSARSYSIVHCQTVTVNGTQYLTR